MARGDLPVTATGKVQKFRLQELLTRYSARPATDRSPGHSRATASTGGEAGETLPGRSYSNRVGRAVPSRATVSETAAGRRRRRHRRAGSRSGSHQAERHREPDHCQDLRPLWLSHTGRTFMSFRRDREGVAGSRRSLSRPSSISRSLGTSSSPPGSLGRGRSLAGLGRRASHRHGDGSAMSSPSKISSAVFGQAVCHAPAAQVGEPLRQPDTSASANRGTLVGAPDGPGGAGWYGASFAVPDCAHRSGGEQWGSRASTTG